MDVEYRIEHDGLQWVLRKEFDANEWGEDRKPTGNIKRKDEIVGYYPLFHQGLARMYDCMVGEACKEVDRLNVNAAMNIAKNIYAGLRDIKAGDRVSV